MGGQNEQASLRSQNNNHDIRNVLSKRRIGKARAVPEQPENTVAMNEDGTNDDTCCWWTNLITFAYKNQSADVYPYNDAYYPIKNVPIVSGATVYDHTTGGTYILVFHKLLYYGMKMQHSLINSNIVCFHGLKVFNNPVRNEELYIEVDDETLITLQSKGATCVFKSRVSTHRELDSCTHYGIENDPDWNPQ